MDSAYHMCRLGCSYCGMHAFPPTLRFILNQRQGFGFVHDWVVLIPLRILLGILEAGLFPGVIYVLSLWYTRCMLPSILLPSQ